LTYLNMRNGITDALKIFNATNNPNLTCIETLDPTYATANWTSANGNIDAGVTFSVICGGTDLTTWHVDSTGSDASGSGTEMSPLATIQTGINIATEGDTVLVAAGTYNENITIHGKKIVLGSHILITENSSYTDSTILDGSGLESSVINTSGGSEFRGFTIKNGKGSPDDGRTGEIINRGGGLIGGDAIIRDMIFEENRVTEGGGAIRVEGGGSVIIKNTIIRNNYAKMYGAAINIWDGNIIADNLLIYANESDGSLFYFGGGGTATLKNSTIVDNKTNPIFGVGNNDLIMTNSIIRYSNDLLNIGGNGTAIITYSNIEGGYTGTGNIDADPMFCDTLSYKYYATSPVVGTGENGVNMGAGGIGCDVPQAFEWVSSALDTINITKTNLTDTYTAQWTESKDVYGDTIKYLLYAKIGVYPSELIYDTTVTTLPLSYQEIVENVFEGMPNERATVRFSVSATDGIDTVKVTGDDRVLFVNRYEYLSTVSEGIPNEFALHENYPNPFNPTTTLRFDLPKVSDVTLTIYNMLGQKIKTFNMNDTPAGYHSIKWDATNDYGDPVGAGVYLYQLRANQFVKTKKMVLLK
jgi:hypothetical protein